MPNKLDEQRQQFQTQVDKEVLTSLEFGMEGSIGHAGGKLTGFSIKIGESDYLMTVRADFDAGRQVCFVGGPSLGDLFRKVVTDAYSNKLSWREDVYG